MIRSAFEDVLRPRELRLSDLWVLPMDNRSLTIPVTIPSNYNSAEHHHDTVLLTHQRHYWCRVENSWVVWNTEIRQPTVLQWRPDDRAAIDAEFVTFCRVCRHARRSFVGSGKRANCASTALRYEWTAVLGEPGQLSLPGIGKRSPHGANSGRENTNFANDGYRATTNGDSHYNALQVVMTKRVSHGLQIVGAYTYSKVLDDIQGQIRTFRVHLPDRLPGGTE